MDCQLNAYWKIMTKALTTPLMLRQIAMMAKMIHATAMMGTTLEENFATILSPLKMRIAATTAMIAANTRLLLSKAKAPQRAEDALQDWTPTNPIPKVRTRRMAAKTPSFLLPRPFWA